MIRKGRDHEPVSFIKWLRGSGHKWAFLNAAVNKVHHRRASNGQKNDQAKNNRSNLSGTEFQGPASASASPGIFGVLRPVARSSTQANSALPTRFGVPLPVAESLEMVAREYLLA